MAECVLLLWRCWGWLGQIILSEAVGRKPGNVGLASSPPSILTQRMGGQALGQQPVTQTSASWRSHVWGCTALCLALGCFPQSNKQGSTPRSSRSVHKQQESYPNPKPENLRLGGKLKSSNTHVMLDPQWRAQMRAQKAFSENTHQCRALHFWKWGSDRQSWKILSRWFWFQSWLKWLVITLGKGPASWGAVTEHSFQRDPSTLGSSLRKIPQGGDGNGRAKISPPTRLHSRVTAKQIERHPLAQRTASVMVKL